MGGQAKTMSARKHNNIQQLGYRLFILSTCAVRYGTCILLAEQLVQLDEGVTQASCLILEAIRKDGLFLFGGPDCVALWHDRKEFRAWVMCRTFKHSPVLNHIPVSVCSSGGVFHCCHVFWIQHNRLALHRAFNLINNIGDPIAVSDNATLVNMPTEEKHLRCDGRQPFCFSASVYGAKLDIR